MTTAKGTDAWVQAVADQIRERCQPSGAGNSGPVWVDGGVHDGSLVVLYRTAPDGPVVGFVRDVREWPSQFVSSGGPTIDPVELGNLIYEDQIEDPSSLRHDQPAAALAERWTPAGVTVHWDLDRSPA